MSGLGAYLDALYGAEPEGGLIEVRQLPSGRQSWHDCRDRHGVAAVLRDAQHENVCVGAAPRRRRCGRRDAVERVHVLWADCDGAGSLAALRRFRPLPAIVVRSGSPDSVHVYWPLWPPATPDEAERANRRLAHALGADMGATDAARILRPPGTLNFKTDPPAPVEVAHLAAEVFTLEQVAGALPDPPGPRREPARPRTVEPGDDRLLAIPPPVYVEALTGRPVGRDGKCRCPFHEDRTPSLHAYDEPAEGWFAFCCQRGGTIYDLARELSGIGDRGADFRELRAWIAERLLAPSGEQVAA